MISSLVLLATLLLIQAQMPWAFLATWAHCWLCSAAVRQHPQILFCQAAFQPLCQNLVTLHGIFVTRGQDLSLCLIEPHPSGLYPWIQPVQIPLQSLPALQQINSPIQLGIICKMTEGALSPLIQIVDEDIKRDWSHY
ncbi:integral membrane protein dgcr2 idd [Pitangus sulphuratus]|nr:integral membrane protein dgcr2 idd [Pitangus sulphuratus]